MNDFEKQRIEKLQRNFEKTQAREDAKLQRKLQAMNNDLQAYKRKLHLDLLVEYCESDMQPTKALIRDIEKDGFNFQSLWEEANYIFQRKMLDLLKNSLREVLLETPTIDYDKLKECYTTGDEAPATVEDYDIVLSELKEEFAIEYDKIVNKIVKKELSYTDERLRVYAILLGKSAKEVAEEIKAKQAVEETERERERVRKEEEKRKKVCSESFRNISDKAGNLMAKNVEEGLKFISEYPDVEDILAGCSKSMENLVDAAKSKAIELKNKAKEDNISELKRSIRSTERSIEEIKHKMMLFCILAVIFLFVGFILGVIFGYIAFKKWKKLEKAKLQLVGLQKELQIVSEEKMHL